MSGPLRNAPALGEPCLDLDRLRQCSLRDSGWPLGVRPRPPSADRRPRATHPERCANWPRVGSLQEPFCTKLRRGEIRPSGDTDGQTEREQYSACYADRVADRVSKQKWHQRNEPMDKLPTRTRTKHGHGRENLLLAERPTRCCR